MLEARFHVGDRVLAVAAHLRDQTAHRAVRRAHAAAAGAAVGRLAHHDQLDAFGRFGGVLTDQILMRQRHLQLARAVGAFPELDNARWNVLDVIGVVATDSECQCEVRVGVAVDRKNFASVLGQDASERTGDCRLARATLAYRCDFHPDLQRHLSTDALYARRAQLVPEGKVCSNAALR